jgi:nucleoside-diphosphate-sugar epimerase
MNKTIALIGYGPVGQATSALLARQGRPIRVGQRARPRSLPEGVDFKPCDVLHAASVRAFIADAAEVVLSIGFPYVGAVWRDAWPRAIVNVLKACAASGARLVFVDNLYMYGPRDAPLTEDTPLSDFGVKPAARAEVTRIWRQAHDAGRVRVTALRPPDFYGPGVTLSWLGETGFAALAKGRAAMTLAPDTPHDFAYVPDIARATAALIDAPDDAFGQAWHMPCAPTLTPRQILALASATLGAPARVRALPLWALPALGLFVPMLREVSEMRFQWNRPYLVDSRRFVSRFGFSATPFEIGAPATALSFR